MSIVRHKIARHKITSSDCRLGVCNKLMKVYVEKYVHMIRCSLSSTLSSVKHMLKDVNHKAQIASVNSPLGSYQLEISWEAAA